VEGGWTACFPSRAAASASRDEGDDNYAAGDDRDVIADALAAEAHGGKGDPGERTPASSPSPEPTLAPALLGCEGVGGVAERSPKAERSVGEGEGEGGRGGAADWK
jgi:hypothetical protein